MSTSKKKNQTQNDPKAAIEFARLLGDDWGQHFYALVDGSMVPLFVGGSDILEVSDNYDEIIEWLNEHHKHRHNIYYALNPISREAVNTRAPKEMVASVHWVHVDIDPKNFENRPKIGNVNANITPQEYLLSEQKRIAELVSNEAMLKSKGLPGLPTFDIISGRGRQVLWKLSSPMEIEGSEIERTSSIELAEEHNRGVGVVLGGDKSCWDISRLLRLPGTVNFPNKKKLAQGVAPEGVLAELATHRDGAKYALHAFPKVAKEGTDYAQAPRSPSEKKAASAGETVKKPRVKVKKVFITDMPEEPADYCDDLAGLMDRWGVSQRTGERIMFGGNEIDPREYDSRSENVFGICRELLRKGVAPKHVLWVITNPDFAISAHCRDPEKNKGHRGMIPYAQRQVTNAQAANAEEAAAERERAEAMAGGGDNGGGKSEPPSGSCGGGRGGRRELSRDAPNASAALFHKEEMPHLLFSAQEFLNYDAGRYIGLEEHDVRVSVRRYLVDSIAVRQQGKITVREPFEPKKLHVSEITAALAETCSKPSVRDERSGALVHSALPVWLTKQEGDPDPKDIMSFPNGLLDLKTGALLPPTPRFFTRNKRSFDYDANAPEPTRWLQFLEECWPGQADTHALIRQMMGYLISSDTSRQAIFTIVGPGGCGKGVFRSVLEGLVGSANTAYPSLSDLAEKFTLESCVSAQMAILSDAHLPEKADDATKAMEALKKISGGDPVHVNRKGIKGMANVKLGMRFVIFANSIPDFKDPGGALAQRMVPIPMRRRFRGTDEQDYDLESKLEAELPGILNWAIEGLHDLNSKKRFSLSKKSSEELENIKERQSPLFEFQEDYLSVSEDVACSKDDLHELYLAWFAKQEKGKNITSSKARNVFFRELVPTLNHAINLNYREKTGGPRMVKGVTISPTGLELLQAWRKNKSDADASKKLRSEGERVTTQDEIDAWEARFGKGSWGDKK